MAVLAIVLPCKKHYVRSRKYLISQLGKVPILKWILVNIYLLYGLNAKPFVVEKYLTCKEHIMS